MKPYLVSLALGVLVGVIYALFNVRSPAPPVIALAGLFGILVGEQIPSVVRTVWVRESVALFTEQVGPHVFGRLPSGRPTAVVQAKPAAEADRAPGDPS